MSGAAPDSANCALALIRVDTLSRPDKIVRARICTSHEPASASFRIHTQLCVLYSLSPTDEVTFICSRCSLSYPRLPIPPPHKLKTSRCAVEHAITRRSAVSFRIERNCLALLNLQPFLSAAPCNFITPPMISWFI